MKQEVYLVEVGVLYNKDDTNYSDVYDKKYAYCAKDQFYIGIMADAEDYVNLYVKNGVINTYGIVSIAYIDSSILKTEDIFQIPVSGEKYSPENVIYSVYKNSDEQIIPDFIEM